MRGFFIPSIWVPFLARIIVFNTSFLLIILGTFFIYLTSAMPDFLLGTPFLKGWGDLISITSILPTVGFESDKLLIDLTFRESPVSLTASLITSALPITIGLQ